MLLILRNCIPASLSMHIQMLGEYLKNKPDVGTVKIQFYSQFKMILHHNFLIGRMILLHLETTGRCSLLSWLSVFVECCAVEILPAELTFLPLPTL
jgi:hypothetical protein